MDIALIHRAWEAAPMILTESDITIRHLGPADAASVTRLAQRDSSPTPSGALLGAFGPDGTLLATVSLDSGDLVADPFEHTAHVAALLRLRARQLRGAQAEATTRPGHGERSARPSLGHRVPAAR
jgi:hypothetical protein